MKPTEWNFDEISSSHLWFLRLLGLVPLAGKTLEHYVTKLLLCYFHAMNVLYNGMWLGYGVRMVARQRFEVDFLCELMVVEAVCFRYLLLYGSRRKLVAVVDSCRRLWTFVASEHECQVVRSFERKAFYFRTFMLVNSLAVVASFILTAQFTRVPGPDGVNDTERRVLPFRFFVEVNDEPTFTRVCLLQYVVTCTIAFEVAGIETVGLYLIMMSCGYLRVLRNRLMKFRGDHDDEKCSSDELLNCARFHQSIMLFCEGIENTTRDVFFFAVFTTVYNMSITGIKILENDEDVFKFVAIFTMNLFQFFIVQWGPEYLLTESEAIGDAAYFASTRQPSYTAKNSKAVLMMMTRAQRPFQLTAGGYISLSIETFGMMVRSAFSFFTLLRSFKS